MLTEITEYRAHPHVHTGSPAGRETLMGYPAVPVANGKYTTEFHSYYYWFSVLPS
jgi:hypothetical protein